MWHTLHIGTWDIWSYSTYVGWERSTGHQKQLSKQGNYIKSTWHISKVDLLEIVLQTHAACVCIFYTLRTPTDLFLRMRLRFLNPSRSMWLGILNVKFAQLIVEYSDMLLISRYVRLPFDLIAFLSCFYYSCSYICLWTCNESSWIFISFFILLFK